MRGKRLKVVVYSEPGFRGKRRTLRCAAGTRRVHTVESTGLDGVGSVQLQRFRYGFIPALGSFLLLWQSIGLLVSSRSGARQEASMAFVWGVVSLPRVLIPSAWRYRRDPAGDRQAWVRLWSEEPVEPPPGHHITWRNVVADTEDTNDWRTRTRYLELGIGRPGRGPDR